MPKLNELIQKLCPNGVDFLELEKVIYSLNTGLNPRGFFRLNTDDATNYYVTIREIHNNKIKFSESTDRINDEALRLCNNRSNLETGDILFSGTGTIGETALISETPSNWNIKEGVYVLKPNTKKIISKFLMYLLQSDAVRASYLKKVSGGTVKSIPMKELRKIKIPVPPLPIQNEIVRILDHLTEHTAELTAELATELTKRKQQYEYYQNALMDPYNIKEIKYMTVKKCIVSLKTGLNPRQNFKLNVKDSVCPYITGKDIYNNSINVSERTDKITSQAVELINKRAKLENNLLLFASTGTGTIGRMAIINKYEYNWGISETLYAIKPNPELLITEYLMYALYSQNAKNQFEPKISKGSVPHLKVIDLLKVSIPVPSIEEQNKIVAILKHFGKICNDTSSAFSEEITSRQKQYKYYKDKLLTFKELTT